MKSSPESIAVIGGGVIGAFVAYHLARKGRQVAIIEKGSFGRGSSWGNCGIILPSHLLPLNSVENVVVAAGHNMLGLSLAPVTGKMVAAMLLGEEPPVDPAPYRLNRFRLRKR